jgi:hypothetical protein
MCCAGVVLGCVTSVLQRLGTLSHQAQVVSDPAHGAAGLRRLCFW